MWLSIVVSQSLALGIQRAHLNSYMRLGTFYEPKSWSHKIQRTLMLETDVPETLNEMLVSVRKMGRCGIIAAYAGFVNGVNVGALMEKGVRYVMRCSTQVSSGSDGRLG